MKAADEFVMGYTNDNPAVSERAIRNHRAFFLGEMERFGSNNYELGYAYATERLARACERKGATNEARSLRRELAEYVSTMHKTLSTGDVAIAVSILDVKMGKHAGELHRLKGNSP
jgi:hypothetical protein